jgi:hypothetical protein
MAYQPTSSPGGVPPVTNVPGNGVELSPVAQQRFDAREAHEAKVAAGRAWKNALAAKITWE